MEGCEVCGSTRGLDRHHLKAKGMGGSRESSVLAESNLTTLCRSCHRNLHEGRWRLERSDRGIKLVDASNGHTIMRRLRDSSLDVPSLFQALNAADDSLSRLIRSLPYVSDEQLVEAFRYATSFGKRAWLLQAAILYEGQHRSVYGERTLEALARRFEIGLRQAQKYALVWKQFFNQEGEEHVNIDAILLEEPSWYVVAATETKDPQQWLEYAQDRKTEDPSYSVASFRRDILMAKLVDSAANPHGPPVPAVALPQLQGNPCPWLRLVCVRSGQQVPAAACPCG